MADDALTPERLAEALSRVGPDDELPIYWRRLIVGASDEITRLLDRLEAAEARTVSLDEAYETVVATNRQLLRERDEARAARDPRAELVQVGWGGCVGHSTCEVDEGHEWYLRHLDDKHELISDHPIWPVFARRSVPGAVAGAPGGEQQ